MFKACPSLMPCNLKCILLNILFVNLCHNLCFIILSLH